MYQLISSTSLADFGGSNNISSIDYLYKIKKGSYTKKICDDLKQKDDLLLRLVIPNNKNKFSTDFIEILAFNQSPSFDQHSFSNILNFVSKFLRSLTMQIQNGQEIAVINSKLSIVTTSWANLKYLLEWLRKTKSEDNTKNITNSFSEEFNVATMQQYNSFYFDLFEKNLGEQNEIDMVILCRSYLYFLALLESLDHHDKEWNLLTDNNIEPKYYNILKEIIKN